MQPRFSPKLRGSGYAFRRVKPELGGFCPAGRWTFQNKIRRDRNNDPSLRDFACKKGRVAGPRPMGTEAARAFSTYPPKYRATSVSHEGFDFSERCRDSRDTVNGGAGESRAKKGERWTKCIEAGRSRGAEKQRSDEVSRGVRSYP